jgi:hypothetical protein
MGRGLIPSSPRQSCPFIYAHFIICSNRKLTSSITIEQKNPIAVFMYALKAAESRRQYPRRFKIFLDYLKWHKNVLKPLC